MVKLDDYRVGVDARHNRVTNVGEPKLPTDGMPFRVPNLTTTERDALPDIQNGLIILNTTTNKIQARVNGSWVDLN
mgnify:CR=1 FL=1|jgi:hypothetical protein